jgi:hypothetical protein
MALNAPIPDFAPYPLDEQGNFILSKPDLAYWRIAEHRMLGPRQLEVTMAAYTSEAQRRAGDDPVRTEMLCLIVPAVPRHGEIDRAQAYRIVKQYDPFKGASDA